MIELQGISKSYKTPSGKHYVFRNLNITIPEGKSVGLIGHNGAGKTTLLNVMGGINKPDRGRVVTTKSISWPVGLTGGFQGSMTGRENVKFVCRLYTHESAFREKIGFVNDFADIGEYFDMPVKTYSSGMRARLSFALSMAFDFDYYLIDEITAVGDANFHEKSTAMLQKKREKANFILASHDMTSIDRFCDIALLIGRGKVRLFENVADAIEAYQNDEAIHQADHV